MAATSKKSPLKPTKKTTSSKKRKPTTKKKAAKTKRQLETEARNKKAEAVLELIKKGMSKRKALIVKKMGMGSFELWLEELTPEEIKEGVTKSEFNRNRYTRATDDRVDTIVDEMYDIADNGKLDMKTITKKDGTTFEVVDREVVERSKIQIDLRKWHLAKMRPNDYGDKVEVKAEQDITISFK